MYEPKWYDFLLMLFPRYVTDEVALGKDGERYYVICLKCQVMTEDKKYIVAYGTARTFTWFNHCRGTKVKVTEVV